MSALMIPTLLNKFTNYNKKLVELYKHLRLRDIVWSPYENIYYCCTQKTASQWLKAVFSDITVYKYTGLLVHPYSEPGLRYASFNEAFPKRMIVTHLYISYPTYFTITKPANFKTFFLLRDPRDIVVSWYFSAKYSHNLVHSLPQLRSDLQKLNLIDGLKYSIDRLEEFKLFEAQRSWMDAYIKKHNIKIFRYEDLSQDNQSFLKQVFDYLKIVMPEKDFAALYDRHKFENYANGRRQGEENIKEHNRKGIVGDWKNYFDYSTTNYFKQVTKDLIEVLGYLE